MNLKSSNFKIYLGGVYIIILSLGLYFLFTTFDLNDLTSYEFIRENRGLILKYKENNIFFMIIIFFIIVVLLNLLLCPMAGNSNLSLWKYPWWCFIVPFSKNFF
jgi:uncharacterized membrane protein